MLLISFLKYTITYHYLIPAYFYVRTFSAANKYYSSVGHHEQKNKKTTGQIKFLAVIIKQQIKLVLRHSLCKNEFNVMLQVLPLQFHIQYFLSSQITDNNILLHLLTRSPRTTNVCFLCSNR